MNTTPRQHHPGAILWDMDGTLIDTEPYWMEAETELVESYGASWSQEQAFRLVGNALTVSGAIIKEQTGIPLEVEEIVDGLLERVIVKLRQHVPWRPGARDLLSEARAAGVPCALVTMSYASFANVLMDAVAPGTFEVLVTGDMVTHGKPHPEPYERAAQELGMKPNECVALEDSPTGMRSAVAAGVPVVVIPHIVAVPQAPGTVQVASLNGVTLERLAVLAGKAASSRELAAQG